MQCQYKTCVVAVLVSECLLLYKLPVNSLFIETFSLLEGNDKGFYYMNELFGL